MLKRSLAYSPYIMYVFFLFWIPIYHLFLIFQNAPKVVQKRTPSKKLHKMFKTDMYLQYSQTYVWVSASKHSMWARKRHSVHYMHFSSRALDFANSSKMQRMFYCFWGEPFQWRFPSRHLHRSLLYSAHRSHCLCFSIFVLYFLQYRFLYHCTFSYVVSKKKTYKSFAKFLMKNSCVIEKYIINVTYFENDVDALFSKKKHVK